MSIRKCGGHRRLCLEPSLERIESRQLPSAIITMLPFLSGHLPPIHAHAAGTSGGGTTTPMDQPTPHELRREAFSARYQGTYTIGPGRFTDQAEQIFFVGAGNSSAFRHANMQMDFFIPVNPSGTITGQVSMFVKNYSNTGNLLILDLQGNMQSLFHGVPTQFTWTVNGSSAGTFSGSTGQGTGQILYTPGGRLPDRATGAGHFGVVFTGMIDTTGVSSPLRF